MDVMTVLSQLCAAFGMEGMHSGQGATSTAEQGVIRVKDFMVGLSMLGYGKKSEKLAAGFDFLDEFNMGSLSSTQFGRLMKSFLCMLAALNAELMALAGETREELIDEVVAKLTAEAFSVVSSSDRHQRRRVALTFEEFGSWYNTQSSNLAPWVQILDLNKWPGCETVQSVSADDGTEDDDYVHVGDFPFVCSLLPPGRSARDYHGALCALQLSADDFANMAVIQQLTDFGAHRATDVINMFTQGGNKKETTPKHGQRVVVSVTGVGGVGPQSVELAKQKKLQAATAKTQASKVATPRPVLTVSLPSGGAQPVLTSPGPPSRSSSPRFKVGTQKIRC